MEYCTTNYTIEHLNKTQIKSKLKSINILNQKIIDDNHMFIVTYNLFDQDKKDEIFLFRFDLENKTISLMLSCFLGIDRTLYSTNSYEEEMLEDIKKCMESKTLHEFINFNYNFNSKDICSEELNICYEFKDFMKNILIENINTIWYN